jgi:Zn-finger nucleic acid-binding protein
MTYRDRAVQCPRCGVELTRADARDRWRCGKCKGALFSVGEVVRELVVTAPDLVGTGGVVGLTTLGRRTIAPLLDCSVCGGPMEPVFLGGVDVDRCYHDELIWFDRGELALVVDVATDQHRDRDQSWLVRMLAFWFIG